MIKKAAITEIKEAIAILPDRQKQQLLADLQKEYAASEFRKAVENIRSKAKPVSFKEITRITEKVRQRMYEERIPSRH